MGPRKQKLAGSREDPSTTLDPLSIDPKLSHSAPFDAHCRMKKVLYDLIVIGSGPGGYSSAIRAAQYGLKTALVEKQPKLGGTCLLVGCIPTKALLQTADVWQRFVHSEDEGIHCENPRLDYPKVKDRKDGIVNKHSKGVEFLLKRAKVERFTGYATLKGGGKVEVKSDSGV